MNKPNPPIPKAYCGERNGVRFAGIHLIIDLWGPKHLTEPDYCEKALVEAVTACGATVRSVDFHVFSPNGGVSGVVVLEESHISIHTWPEYSYAAVDVFMCGTLDPGNAVSVLEEFFEPERVEVSELFRGVLNQ